MTAALLTSCTKYCRRRQLETKGGSQIGKCRNRKSGKEQAKTVTKNLLFTFPDIKNIIVQVKPGFAEKIQMLVLTVLQNVNCSKQKLIKVKKIIHNDTDFTKTFSLTDKNFVSASVKLKEETSVLQVAGELKSFEELNHSCLQ